MRIRLRQNKLIMAGSIGAATMLLISITGGYFYISHLEKKHKKETIGITEQLQTTKKQLEEERVPVTIMKSDHLAGDRILETDLATAEMPKSLVPTDVVNKDAIIGKYIKIAIQKNTPIISSMLYEDEVTPNDLRNEQFSFIQLLVKMKKNDFVDVRIKFPTGQDYVLLSKKKVEEITNNTLWFHMNEREILSMSSGIVDAYLNDATIYAISYVDPFVQDKAIVTYPPNMKVLDLIDSDPNIVEVAKTELERTYRQRLDADMNSLSDADRQNYRSHKEDSAAISEQTVTEDNTLSDQNNSETGTNSNTNLDTINTNLFNQNNQNQPAK
jgi:hypothetical protein